MDALAGLPGRCLLTHTCRPSLTTQSSQNFSAPASPPTIWDPSTTSPKHMRISTNACACALRGLGPRCLWEMEISGRDSTDAQSPTLQTSPSMQCPVEKCASETPGIAVYAEVQKYAGACGWGGHAEKAARGKGKVESSPLRRGSVVPASVLQGCVYSCETCGMSS